MSQEIIDEMNRRKKVYMIPGKLFDNVFIRFVVNCNTMTSDDIKNCAQEVFAATDIVMERHNDLVIANKEVVPTKTERSPSITIGTFVKCVDSDCPNLVGSMPEIRKNAAFVL